MKIECTEERLSDLDVLSGKHYVLKKGDQVEVSDDYGARLCRLGWAKDTSGKVKSNPRVPGPELPPVKLEVQNASMGSRGRTRG